MRSARRVWLLAAVAGIVAVVVANVALLGLATERHDPVGRLQPVTALDVTVRAGAAPAPTTTTTEDDDSSEHDERDD